MDLDTPYLTDCKKLSQLSGFSIEELFDDVIALVIDKEHKYYGKIGLLDRTLYGNAASDVGYRIMFLDKTFFEFNNEFRKGMPKQLVVSKNFEDILKEKEKMSYLFDVN